MTALNNSSNQSSQVGQQPLQSKFVANDIDDTKSRIGDEYVLIRKGDSALNIPILKRATIIKGEDDSKDVSGNGKTDTKQNIAAQYAARAKEVLSRARKVGSGNSMTVFAKLASATLFTSGANAAQFPVVTVTPSGYQDFSFFQNVYDEYRVRSIDAHALVTPSASPTTLGRAWGLAFDPGNSGAYGVIYDTLSAQKCIGPISIPSVIVQSVGDKSGFHSFSSGKLLPLLRANGGSVDPVAGGSWCSTSDTGMIAGYFKGAVDAIGATLTTNLSVWTVLHVEFRMRT